MVRTNRPSNRGYEPSSEKAAQTPNAVYLRDRDGLRKRGHLMVVDPETAIKIIREYISAVPLTHYYSGPYPLDCRPGGPAALRAIRIKSDPSDQPRRNVINTIHDDR
jgi:hypothetical protein